MHFFFLLSLRSFRCLNSDLMTFCGFGLVTGQTSATYGQPPSPEEVGARFPTGVVETANNCNNSNRNSHNSSRRPSSKKLNRTKQSVDSRRLPVRRSRLSYMTWISTRTLWVSSFDMLFGKIVNLLFFFLALYIEWVGGGGV